MDLETALQIVETMIRTQDQAWDEDYLSEDEYEALKVAVNCINSVLYIKKAINS